ncbi:MAG: GIY-YIG nuclease family protein, partial [Firmicutes bacterium]|nr:GIY-YIG nuclease family protein [Bacillota bacterium]
MFDIPAELKKIPHQPGVYLMHEGDLILYVGKAVDLHNRVRQYFQSPKGKSEIIRRMVQRIEYFEYIVTDTEMEALILENNLIKKHRPPYNTLLKDDKQYPYIKVTTQEAFPRIYKTRKILRDGARY